MNSFIAIGLLLYLWLCIINPRTGLYLALLALPAYVIRFSIGGIPTNLFEMLVLVLTAVVAAKILFKQEQVKFQFPTELIVGFVFLAVGLIVGCITTPELFPALGIVKGWFIIPAILMLLIWQTAAKNNPIPIIQALLVSTLPLTLVAVWQSYTGEFITVDQRASAWFSSANYLSLYVVPILLISLGWLTNTKTIKSIIGWAIWGIGFIAVVLSYSFGGWGALGIGLITYLAIANKNRLWLWYGLAAAVISGVVLFFTNHRFGQLFNLAERSSGSVRLQVWATSLAMLKDNWLAGLGLGSFEGNYLAYATKLYHPPIETNILHPHSLYLQLLISMGVVGLIGFGWTVIQWWRKLSLMVPSPMQAALGAGMVAVLTHGLIDTTFFKNDLAVIWWLLIALVYLPHVQKQ